MLPQIPPPAAPERVEEVASNLLSGAAPPRVAAYLGLAYRHAFGPGAPLYAGGIRAGRHPAPRRGPRLPEPSSDLDTPRGCAPHPRADPAGEPPRAAGSRQHISHSALVRSTKTGSARSSRRMPPTAEIVTALIPTRGWAGAAGTACAPWMIRFQGIHPGARVPQCCQAETATGCGRRLRRQYRNLEGPIRVV